MTRADPWVDMRAEFPSAKRWTYLAHAAVAATGLPCGPGDNVVLVDREFPSNVRPWLHLKRRGVEVP